MAEGLKFLAAQAALALLGAGAAWHPSVRSLSAVSRAGVSLCAGAVALTLEATIFSIVGIPWSIPGLAAPLLVLSAGAAVRWRRKPHPCREPVSWRRGVALWSGLACAVALLYLGLSFGSSASGSTDFLYFWGVKAVRFADNRGISAEFLRHPFAIHASLDYPPLVPIVDAWGCLAAGRMPWRAVPLFSALWLVAAIPLLFERCRRLIGDDSSAGVVTFWTVAMSVALVNSYSAGSAEPTLVFFETVALAWLLTERSPGESRFVPTVALCGAALTKVEGLLAVLLIAAGSYLRDRPLPMRWAAARSLKLIVGPAAALSLWFFYQWSRSLEVGYRAHGELLAVYTDLLGVTLKALWRSMDAGSLGLPWVFAILLILGRARAWRAAAPALALAGGLAAFLVFDYLHDKDDPTNRIGWTAPRVIQPALSAVILAAGVLSLSERRPDGPAGRRT
jgi:hypothetical protein